MQLLTLFFFKFSDHNDIRLLRPAKMYTTEPYFSTGLVGVTP